MTKQPEHPLILELLEPLLNMIQHSMRSKGSTKQEQDLLHKTARIFMCVLVPWVTQSPG